LVEKPQGNKPLDYIMYIKGDRQVVGSCEHGNECAYSTQREEFSEQPGYVSLLLHAVTTYNAMVYKIDL
jgi:hypothetical protein